MWFWDAVASAGHYAKNLHLAPDRWPHPIARSLNKYAVFQKNFTPFLFVL